MPTRFGGLRVFIRWCLLLREHWAALGRVAALAVLIGAVAGVTPFLAKLLIDGVYPTGDVTLLQLLVLGIAAIGVVTAILGALRGYYVQVIDAEIGGAATLRFVNHLQHLPLGFHEQRQTGELLARVQDVRTALRFTTSVYSTLLLGIVYVVVVPVALFIISPKLAFLALALVPIPVMVQAISARVLRRRWQKNTEMVAELQATQTEVLSGIRSVKASGAERQVFDRLRGLVHRTLQTQLSATSAGVLFGVGTSLLRTAGMTVLTLYAWTQILHGTLTLGDYFAFTAYLALLAGPMQQLAGVVGEFQRAVISLVRMFEYLDAVPEQEPTRVQYPAPAFIRRLSGAIQLEAVSVRYERQNPALQDVSCEFPAGCCTAVVGPSGAGKSTLLKLLGRFLEPTTGVVSFGGVPASSIALEELRSQIGVMWQEGTLFRGTMWENLTFGCVGASRRRVEHAVSVCGLDPLLSELPGGFDTPIAEMGATLSAGQRQRILLARSLVKEAPILLLDEPTSNLDVASEQEILRAILSELEGRSVVLVSHRPAVTQFADQVIRLADGRLVPEETEALPEGGPQFPAIGGSIEAPLIPRPWGGVQ